MKKKSIPISSYEGLHSPLMNRHIPDKNKVCSKHSLPSPANISSCDSKLLCLHLQMPDVVLRQFCSHPIHRICPSPNFEEGQHASTHPSANEFHKHFPSILLMVTWQTFRGTAAKPTRVALQPLHLHLKYSVPRRSAGVVGPGKTADSFNHTFKVNQEHQVQRN